jgi:hypothetical protein
VSATRGRCGSWRSHLARLPQRRAGSGERQSADARADRIGTGPWYNVNLELIANILTELHSRTGDAALFLDERGQRIKRTVEPALPVRSSMTCSPDRTRRDLGAWPDVRGLDVDSASVAAIVGHFRRNGPMQNTTPPLSSGTRRTRTRTAQTRRHVEAPAVSIASLARRLRGDLMVGGALAPGRCAG